MTEYLDVRETLKRVKEVAFWDNIIKNTIKHIRKCLSCQKKRLNRKWNIKQKISKPEKI